MYKTTASHFKLFKVECRKWINKLHLGSWEVYFQHENYAAEPQWGAWCKTHYTDRVANLGLAEEWEIKPTEKMIKKAALHEVLELLLSRLFIEALVDTSPSDQDIIKEQRHIVIRRLENLMFDY